eukprot:gene2130-18177_t
MLNGFPLDSGSGLYPLASKAPHSCSPNVFNARSGAKNMLRLVAMKEIKKGDEITYAYKTTRFLAQPRHLRRAALLKERGFECVCSRCLLEEDMCMLACTNKSCSGSVVLDFSSNEYRCRSCKVLHNPEQLPLKMQSSVEEQVMEMENNTQGTSEASVIGLHEKCVSKLGREHWTVFMLEHMLLEIEIQGMVSVPGLPLVGRHLYQWLVKYYVPHHPIAAATLATLFVRKGVLDTEDKELIAALKVLLPYLSLRWGPGDKDVLLWEQLIKKAST